MKTMNPAVSFCVHSLRLKARTAAEATQSRHGTDPSFSIPCNGNSPAFPQTAASAPPWTARAYTAAPRKGRRTGRLEPFRYRRRKRFPANPPCPGPRRRPGRSCGARAPCGRWTELFLLCSCPYCRLRLFPGQDPLSGRPSGGGKTVSPDTPAPEALTFRQASGWFPGAQPVPQRERFHPDRSSPSFSYSYGRPENGCDYPQEPRTHRDKPAGSKPPPVPWNCPPTSSAAQPEKRRTIFRILPPHHCVPRKLPPQEFQFLPVSFTDVRDEAPGGSRLEKSGSKQHSATYHSSSSYSLRSILVRNLSSAPGSACRIFFPSASCTVA